MFLRLLALGFGPFLILAPAVQVTAPALNSLSLTVGLTEQVVTSFVALEPGDPEILPNGVNLQRIQNNVSTVLGVMKDDGTGGDAIANDGIYSLRIPFNETTPTQYSLRTSVALRGRLQRTISSPRDLIFLAAETVASLTVRTFEFDSSALSNIGAPLARAGTIIRVNDIDVGLTGPDGIAILVVPAGNVKVGALIPSVGIGEAQVQLLPGIAKQVDIPIKLGTELSEPCVLQVSEAPSGLLSAAASTLTIELLRRGSAVRLVGFSSVEISNSSGDSTLSTATQFVLTQSGTIRSTNLQALRAQLTSLSQPVSIEVEAWDSDGYSYEASVVVRFQ